ncbi:AraC family transcriptional regulator [Actinomadura rudentiformis]|uniref:HTH-type transcriptional regulator RipA n=1 Tax=Actinomadura rudentiformis TaxID=359158 RepID=A0A6H9ZAP7_9ACTN|nr:helix-turn-helix transcriptional regulator [Actinomadura rudentiformis]KAB2352563.1 AraC family transcriptional regulator [Actinomadura rudentiformis]
MSIPRHTPVAPTGLRRLAPGTGIDAHRHDEHQIVYAARGVLSVITDRGRWIAPATQAIWVPAGTVHEHRAYGRTDVHLVGLPVSANPLGLEAPAVLAVGPLLRELIIEYTRESGDSAERARLRAVLLDQLRHSPRHPVHLPTPSDTRLAAVCALLNDDPADGRTLSELGAQVGASERTLSRLFRAELHMTFPQWRTQLRLHHALILLAAGTPVTAVAHRCGWASPSAFIDVFRRTFGHTPGRNG